MQYVVSLLRKSYIFSILVKASLLPLMYGTVTIHLFFSDFFLIAFLFLLSLLLCVFYLHWIIMLLQGTYTVILFLSAIFFFCHHIITFVEQIPYDS